MKKVLFTATVDSHILHFHIPYLKFFKEQGYEVHVATNSDADIPFCDKKIRIPFERKPIKIKNILAIMKLRRIINDEQYSIIHTHTPMGSVVTRIAAKKAQKCGKTKVIYTAHGFHFYKGSPVLNWIVYYNIEKLLSKFTDVLITINKEDYSIAKNNFKKCKKIVYIPGVGIDLEKFNISLSEHDKKDILEKIGLNDSCFVLSYIARLDKNKNQSFLINAIKKIKKDYPNIHLLLVGDDELQGKYQKMAFDCLDNIHFLGYRSDVNKILKITDISVSSSIREGLPINIIEAMASGIPVVATNARGVRDIIKDEINGFIINDFDMSDFINKILLLYNDDSLRRKIGKINKNESSKYSIDSIMEQIKKVYLE